MVFTPFSSGGKKWEPQGLALRQMLSLGLKEQLDPWKLAPKVGLTVVDRQTALDCLAAQPGGHLLDKGSNKWSGGVYPCPLPDGTFVCILNPVQSIRRNRITLMEEIAHMHLKHVPSKVSLVGGMQVRDYHKEQEEDAYGVGAAALLPWRPFFACINGGMSAEEMASVYDLTPDLITYRIKVTGAYNLYQARQRSRA